MGFEKGRRIRNLYDPASAKPYKLSRSKLDFFFECPRCLYIDRRLGINRPSMPGFTLNMAVDELLKREFDSYRERGEPHPLMVKYGVEAVPFAHDSLDDWRNNRRGVQYHDTDRNLLLFGSVDDIWVDRDGNLMVVDYKATSTSTEITLDGPYREGYKRQLEIYQWLLRKNGFNVSNTAYLVYANGIKSVAGFDNKLTFEVVLLRYVGDDSWVDDHIENVYRCLQSDRLPESSPDCEFCAYEWHRAQVLKDLM